MKKLIIFISISIVLVAIWFFSWEKVKNENQTMLQQIEDQNKQTREWQQTKEADGYDVETDENGWKTFRSDEYGFELNIPDNWRLKTVTARENNRGEALFLFENNNIHFSISPVGYLGHGMQKPLKVTEEGFAGKKARMTWYDNYSFPHFIRVLDNLPKNWDADNLIEVNYFENDQAIISDIQGMYKSFRFIE